jgi:hypothetical protein
MLDWVAQHLTDTERHVLAELVARFDKTSPPLPYPPTEHAKTQSAVSTSTVEREIAVVADQMSFDHPIDGVVLIHKALGVEAWRTETTAERLEISEDLQPFLHTFNIWMKALSFHADMEDADMTPLLPDSPQARDNEVAHARLGYRVKDIQTYLQEIDHHAVTARTRRRLFGKVVARRIDQDNHLEEEFALPIIRHIWVRRNSSKWSHISSSIRMRRMRNGTGCSTGWLKI